MNILQPDDEPRHDDSAGETGDIADENCGETTETDVNPQLTDPSQIDKYVYDSSIYYICHIYIQRYVFLIKSFFQSYSFCWIKDQNCRLDCVSMTIKLGHIDDYF